jgi:hypothetical protein
MHTCRARAQAQRHHRGIFGLRSPATFEHSRCASGCTGLLGTCGVLLAPATDSEQNPAPHYERMNKKSLAICIHSAFKVCCKRWGKEVLLFL